ncbi:MAG: carboxypeptidase-like regulatory domain-containing protein [Acidobacteriaceae bacterium]
MRSFRLANLPFILTLALFATILFAPGTAKAQDSSSMTGVITDATGAAIAGAMVTLTNKTTGLKFTATTNPTGTYHFLSVPPGPGYVETITSAGFAKVEVSDLYLTVGNTRTQNVKLKAGASTVVTVSASNSEVTLDTTDAAIGSNVDVASLNQLPVQDRTSGVTTLFNLQPGVVDTQLGGGLQSGAVTGARTDQTSVTLDGLDVDDIASAATFAIVGAAPVDSVEQFTGTVGGLTAGLGTGSGGQFQLVTKHGTNQFHGNINEYHRDTSTTSNTYFNNDVGVARTPLIRNQFGGNIGGPIVKNKLFFFFDFADSRIIQSAASEPTVPIPSLYASTPTLNYINNGEGCSGSSRLNNDANCISSLPATSTTGQSAQSLDPGGQGFSQGVLDFFAKRYPAPNDPTQGDGVNTEGLRFTYPTPIKQATYVGRIDYNLTKTQKVYGRFTINRENAVYTGPELPGDPDAVLYVDRSYGYVVSHIWTIGRNKVNQFYYGDNISKLNYPVGDFPTSPASYSFTGLSGPYGTDNTQVRRVPIPVVRDDFNWQVKNHSLTTGGLFKFIKASNNDITDFNNVEAGLTGLLSGGLGAALRPSNIDANSSTAKNDYDELYASSLGVIGQISSNFNYNKSGQRTPQGAGAPLAYRYYESEAYFGDSWKVNKQLALTYGLRYQFDSVPYETHGDESVAELQGLGQRQSTFNQYFNDRLEANATGSVTAVLPFFQEILGGKANNGPSFYAPSYKDFAPRLAFAYNPSFSPKTVFNGSAAIVYDRTIINAINFLQDYFSFLFYNNSTNQFGDLKNLDQRLGANLAYDSSLNPVSQPILPPYTPYVSNGQGYGLGAGEEGFVIDPTLKDPYSISLNAGVQQELPFHMVLRANYVGRLGRRLLADADGAQVLNFPDNISGQNLSDAFAGLTAQVRANPSATSFTAEPWFENVIGNYLGGCGSTNCTTLVANTIGSLGYNGDIGDSLYYLAAYGYLPPNVGMPTQFGALPFLTNKGSSNYHALLFSLTKNMSQGLSFNFNYTLSHSIDNNSQASGNNAVYNYSGIICDVTHPRACRGDSDFDVRQIITADFEYNLPFGHNQRFFGDSGTLTNELIGGWSVSGIPSFRTGLPINVLSDAFLASFAAEDPAIFTGNKKDLKASMNNVQGTVYNFAGGATGAAKVYSEFRGPLGLEYGQRNVAHGPHATDLDLGLAKVFPIIPSRNVNLTFRADAFNIFNHPNFNGPAGSAGTNMPDIVDNVSPFGQITSTISPSGQTGDIRVAQFSLRLEF